MADPGVDLQPDQVRSFVEEICAPFGGYRPFFQRLTVHYLAFWVMTVLLPLTIIDKHSCAATEVVGILTHVLYLVLLYFSVAEEVQCAVALLTKRHHATHEQATFLAVDGRVLVLAWPRVRSDGSQARYSVNLDVWSGLAVLDQQGGSKTDALMAALEDSGPDERGPASAEETSWYRQFDSPPAVGSESSAQGAGGINHGARRDGDPVVVFPSAASSTTASSSSRGDPGGGPRGGSSPDATRISTGGPGATRTVGVESTTFVFGTTISSGSDAESSHLKDSRPLTSGTFAGGSSQPARACPLSCAVCAWCGRKFRAILRATYQTYKGREHFHLALREVVWRIDVYLDLVFIFIAKNCGSTLWWPSLAVFVVVNVFLQGILHIIFACTDCDLQLPRNLGFVLYDFALINKAVAFRLPFDYESSVPAPWTVSQSQHALVHLSSASNVHQNRMTSASLSPGTVSWCIMVEKCFLGDLVQILIQVVFLHDHDTPNNVMVYLSVCFGVLNFTLNILSVVFLVFSSWRRSSMERRELEMRIATLKDWGDEGLVEPAGEAGRANVELHPGGSHHPARGAVPAPTSRPSPRVLTVSTPSGSDWTNSLASPGGSPVGGMSVVGAAGAGIVGGLGGMSASARPVDYTNGPAGAGISSTWSQPSFNSGPKEPLGGLGLLEDGPGPPGPVGAAQVVLELSDLGGRPHHPNWSKGEAT